MIINLSFLKPTLGYPMGLFTNYVMLSRWVGGQQNTLASLSLYSRLSIKCVGWNKHVGWKFFEDQIKVLDGISMLVGKCLDNH